MKLYYFRQSQGVPNLGDDLNAWLWPRLLPGAFDEDSDVVFVGIGTILDYRIPRAKKTIVFSSGTGYCRLPTIDDSWQIYCVRGPLSARSLGLDAEFAIADGALLARNFAHTPTQAKRFGVSYIPHGYTSHLAPWKLICEEMGINFISPQIPVEEALLQIASSDLLLAEAMHGAILADALRVPWIPVVSNPKILSFKWRDWCESMGLVYDPVRLIQLWDPPANKWSPGGMRFEAKKLATKARIRRVLRNKARSLSADDVLDGKCAELERRLDDLRGDIASQRFRAGR